MSSRPRIKRLPKELFPLFWDVDPRTIELDKHAKYIIERILELGDMNSFRWLELTYPQQMILETCKTSRRISKKSRNFWMVWYES